MADMKWAESPEIEMDTPSEEPKLSPEAELACQAIYQGLVFFANTSHENRDMMDDWLKEKYQEAVGARLIYVLDKLTDGTDKIVCDPDDFED